MLYLLKGEEILLIEEAIENILISEKNTEKKIFEITDAKILEEALFEVKSPSLFGEKPIFIFKFTDKAYKTLQPKLKLLPENTKLINIQSITLKQFPLWLETKLKKSGFVIDKNIIELLCDHFEGNLLAAKQCIDKLEHLYAKGPLTKEQMMDVLAPSARYNIFDLLNHLSKPLAHKIPVILQNLKEEGTEPAIILWWLSKECRKRQTEEALPKLIEVDEIIKGMKSGNSFEALERAAFSIIGRKLL
jgi:DNA polymerase III delta subunit